MTEIDIKTKHHVKIDGKNIGYIESNYFFPYSDTDFNAEDLRAIADKLDELNEVIK